MTNLKFKKCNTLSLIGSIAAVILLLAGCGGSSNVDEESVKEVQSLLRQGEFEEALALARAGKQKAAGEEELVASWAGIEMQLLARMGRTEELVQLYDDNKKIHEDLEDAAMALTMALYMENRPEDAEKVSSFWSDKTEEKENWILLKLESMIRSGLNAEVMEFLSGIELKSPTFAEGLTRIATQVEDPNLILALLDRALISDPENPAIRSLRGAFYEQNGQIRAAGYEFSKALELAPDESAYKHQLGDFHMRHGNTGVALAVWSNNLEESKDEGLWFKSWFWNRLLRPLPELPKAPAGTMGLFLQYVENLSKDELWNDEAFAELPQGPLLKKDYQELFWLELIQRLKEKDWEKALALTAGDPFAAESLNPELQTMLAEALARKVNGSFPSDRPATAKYYSDTPIEAMPPMLQEWEKSRRNGEVFTDKMQNLLDSDSLFAAALLSAGWAEAALFIEAEPDPSADFPEWFFMDYVVALRYNRSYETAVAFLKSIPERTVKQQGLYAEMLLASESDEDRVQAKSILSEIAKREDIHGERATAILASTRMVDEDYDSAQALIESHPTFPDSVHGKELLGEIAIAREDWETADALLEPLVDQSTIAKEYKVKRLADQKNWGAAMDQLSILIQLYPENSDYKRAYLQFKDYRDGVTPAPDTDSEELTPSATTTNAAAEE